jgi:hypothetical protein
MLHGHTRTFCPGLLGVSNENAAVHIKRRRAEFLYICCSVHKQGPGKRMLRLESLTDER